MVKPLLPPLPDRVQENVRKWTQTRVPELVQAVRGAFSGVGGSVAIGHGASAEGDGIAIGRFVHAQPGEIVVDLEWVRDQVEWTELLKRPPAIGD